VFYSKDIGIPLGAKDKLGLKNFDLAAKSPGVSDYMYIGVIRND
jgi:hypothetical protein